MSVIKKIAGETLIYGLAHILPRVLFFFMTLVYLTYRFPDREDYGEYNELYSYVTILLTILVYRLDTAYFRFGSADKTHKHEVFGASVTWVVLSTVLLVGSILTFSSDIAAALGYQERVHYIQWFAIIIGCDAIATMFYARFRLDSQPKKFLFFRIANVLLTIILILIFLEVIPRIAPDELDSIGNWLGISKELDYVFLANLIASIGILVMLLPQMINIQWKLDMSMLRKMLVYSLPLVIVGLAGNINQAFAVPLQKWFLGGDIVDNISQAGVYAAAAKIALLLNLFTVAFNYAAEPFFFNNASIDLKKEAYGKVALAFTIVCVVVILLIQSFGGLVPYLVGSSYRQALHLVPYLLFAYLFLGLYYNVSIWFKLADMTIVGAIISTIGAVITLSISIIYLPQIGYAASAYAALATYAVMVFLGYISGQKYYAIQYPVSKILFYIVVAALMSIHIQYLLAESMVIPMVIGTIYTLLFVGYVWKRDLSYLFS